MTTLELVQEIVAVLQQQGATLATAESCTGGLIAKTITDVAGASAVFGFGWVTYANDAKFRQLHVQQSTLDTHGAVSEQTAIAMAEGALTESDAALALATTGIAGPTGGTPNKPVGTIWIAIATRGQPTKAWHFCNPLPRNEFRHWACHTALNLLLSHISLAPGE